MVKPSNERRSWHVRANALVFGYAALGLVTLLVPVDFENHRWLVIHLFLLGSVTNCIVTWTEHFAITLLRVPEPSRTGSAWRLIALNLSILLCLWGVSIEVDPLVIFGAFALSMVMAVHSYNLLKLSRKALQNRFAGTVHFYFAGAASVILGIIFGSVAAFEEEGSALRDNLHAAHLHANLFGWIGITVIGTFFTFWPTVLRTKMVEGVMSDARRALPFLLAGVFVSGMALVIDRRYLALAGIGAYAIGMMLAARPFVRTWRQKAPHDLPSVSIAAAALWLAFGVFADFVALFQSSDLSDYAHWLDQAIPVFLVGFAAQILVGALSFLAPVILGGGPAAVRGHIERLSTGWRVRILALNFSAVLIYFSGVFARVGYFLFVVSLAIFVGLVVYAVLRQARLPKDVDSALN